MRRLKIVFCTPALYISGGVERVLSLKANYFAEIYGYDITIILTEGRGKPYAYPLSDKIKVINLNINFEELWSCSFVKKIYVYLKKQHIYKKKLTAELMRIRPDITDSLLRREINFLTRINDGSKKIGELHVSKYNFRNFKDNETNFFKNLFSKIWVSMTIPSLKQLDKFIVLTEEDRYTWKELDNVISIPNPISFEINSLCDLSVKRVLAVGRYDYVKGFDMLLKAWEQVEKVCSDWCLEIFGAGNRQPYEKMASELKIKRYRLNGNTTEIKKEYLKSSLFVVSSRFEGLSMAMLEAMSCGLPVVSYACPCGPRDVISDGVNGILVPKEDVDKLAAAIISVIQSPTYAKKLGENAQKRARDYEIGVIAPKWKSLFDELMK